jgi:hypothetical protein
MTIEARTAESRRETAKVAKHAKTGMGEDPEFQVTKRGHDDA